MEEQVLEKKKNSMYGLEGTAKYFDNQVQMTTRYT